MIDEREVTRLIVSEYMNELLEFSDTDVAIVGAGPSGLTAAYYLAKNGKKVAVFDKRLSIGGGMWAGGMMFSRIVVQRAGKDILDELGITYHHHKEYFVADSVQSVCALGYRATRAGARIFNGIMAEDVIIKNDRVSGLVINWSVVEGFPVDPLTVNSKFVIDATGHEAMVVNTLLRKNRVKLNTPDGDFQGEHSLNMELAEEIIMENAKEVYPGLYVTGMAANAVSGSPRMGPIFGGMLLSGRKVAEEILKRL
ncbi:MAG: thiazole biosynthesis protein [Thermoplasmata archaeon]|nr:thiazole biosynthesis protein [Thermoplasmata archaeon]